MKMCYKLFFFVIFTVVGTVSVLGEPCLDGQGSTNMKACLLCATNGKGKGQCCNDIYYNSNDRDDDFLRGDKPSDGGCIGYGNTWRVPAQGCAYFDKKGQSADRRFYYNTRYAVKYYQSGGFLASTEDLLFYN